MDLSEFHQRFLVGSNFDVCDVTFTHFANFFGNEIDALSEPWPSITVTLVWHSGGLIDNGGFRRLFEICYSGDPDFARTVASYREIGAIDAYQVLMDAFALFPNGRVPVNSADRFSILDEIPKTVTDNLEARFFATEESVTRSLADFIRSHAHEFLALLQ